MDDLTGLADNREAHGWLDSHVRTADLRGEFLSIALVDVDRMQSVNGVFGVEIGDAMICRVGDLLRSATGANDLAARVGGDEFLLAWVGDDVDEAAGEADDLRRRFEELAFELDVGIRLSGPTLSAGVAQLPVPGLPEPPPRVQRLIEQADRALAMAKQAGGNCVRIG